MSSPGPPRAERTQGEPSACAHQIVLPLVLCLVPQP
jgi:hypothetical protein